mmetsp:Transcript_57878/g.187699  ORF Transcript_57878/g.187699 Transcript_57878/m.187699 type:complete len:86 (-) Transcript_57878:171-428(-)
MDVLRNFRVETQTFCPHFLARSRHHADKLPCIKCVAQFPKEARLRVVLRLPSRKAEVALPFVPWLSSWEAEVTLPLVHRMPTRQD